MRGADDGGQIADPLSRVEDNLRDNDEIDGLRERRANVFRCE
jgi:hypothetical protein